MTSSYHKIKAKAVMYKMPANDNWRGLLQKALYGPSPHLAAAIASLQAMFGSRIIKKGKTT